MDIKRVNECNILQLGRGKWAVYTPEFRSETCITDSFEKANYLLQKVNIAIRDVVAKAEGQS